MCDVGISLKCPFISVLGVWVTSVVAQARSAAHHGEEMASDPRGVCELLLLPVPQESKEEHEYRQRHVGRISRNTAEKEDRILMWVVGHSGWLWPLVVFAGACLSCVFVLRILFLRYRRRR